MFFKIKENLTKDEVDLTRVSAYDALLEYGITYLPIPYFKCTIDTHLRIMEFKNAYGEERKFLKGIDDEHGVLQFSNGCYFILLNENSSEEEKRWACAKLLAFIKLGIAKKTPGEIMPASYQDLKSNAFAYQFVSPDVILNQCDIQSYKDIMKYCGVPFKISVEKSKLLKNVSDWTFKYIERVLISNFKIFIDDFLKIHIEN